MRDLAYTGARDICATHAERLRWAMIALEPHRPFPAQGVSELGPVDLAICDRFTVRFAKLQDAMGTKLLPLALELTREPGELSAFIDKLNRLEKIGAIRSAAQWLELREMRNQFAHDYPNDPEIQAALLNKAFALAEQMLGILGEINRFAEGYR